ncbi:membrane protein insertase YidC [Dellaglioa carnosa]|uniref:membrane protein insertase YidC n=1 Tax=Dellaglioa carnosa TaxID=2995136 RepID=UPI0022A82809|nr:membrane protein insertase YidC [Dellaglioa carnosa]MCZ2492735.1 membrane protein insertase YidC [Dellaglioa carnosa]
MKKLKRLTMLPIFMAIILFLSGCVRQDKNGNPYGMVYDYLAKPTQGLIEWLSAHLGNNYGFAIIVISFVIRMALMPMMINQSKKATVQQEKMGSIQPQLKVIQERQKAAKSPEDKAAINQEMMALYKDNNVSMTGGIGCLPLLIQMPIFAALYAAILYSAELNGAVFFGIKLGSPSIIFTVLCFIVYLGQGFISIIGLPPEQKKTMQMMLIASPVMMVFVTLSAPAGIGLYFFIGGIFACIQTFIIMLMRPRIRREIQAELAKNPPIVREHTIIDDVEETVERTLDNVEDNISDTAKKNRNRNAGKQNRK